MTQKSVLIVDDDIKLVELLELYFQKDGFIVYTANDGLTALKTAREKNGYTGTRLDASWNGWMGYLQDTSAGK